VDQEADDGVHGLGRLLLRRAKAAAVHTPLSMRWTFRVMPRRAHMPCRISAMFASGSCTATLMAMPPA